MTPAERQQMQDILRTALKKAVLPGATPVAPGGYRRTDPAPADLTPGFISELTTVGGCVHEPHTNDAATIARLIATIAAEAVIKRALMWDDPWLPIPGLAAALETHGFTIDRQQTDDLASDARRAALATATIGITGADAALSDTGSLVLVSGPGRGRLASLLPPVHIALVERTRLMRSLPDLLLTRPELATAGSNLVCITGPSRTADIEHTLSRGVHGPKEVHVILLATGDGRPATGDWRLATGDGRLTTGDRRRATGDWRLATERFTKMTGRFTFLAATTLGTLILSAGVSTTVLLARQAPVEEVMPGSKMTRQQVLDTLTSAAPGTKVSAARGKQLFDEVCAACHIFGETGTSVGPDLTTLSSRFARRDVLDSILWPSRTISDQYAVTIFELTDGTYASGVVVREDARAVYLKNSEYLDRPLPVALGRIKERTESTVSLMPEGLVAAHSLDDIDSLVAYVLGGK